MLSEKDLSLAVAKSVRPFHIYMCVCARARVCVFVFKIIKIENLAMLDKILPHEILYAMPNLQHNNTAKSS